MSYTVSRVDVWAGEIQDRPGALAAKLTALSEAGANLEFMIGRRDQPNTGVVFVAPLKGARPTKAAKAAGLTKAETMHSVRLEGPDQRGLGARITSALGDAGINLRGISAAALGNKQVTYFAFDTAEDAGQAARVLKKVLAK
jgi:hypothetical protein